MRREPARVQLALDLGTPPDDARVLARRNGHTHELELLALPDDPDALSRRLRAGWRSRELDDVRAELHADDPDPEEARP